MPLEIQKSADPKRPGVVTLKLIGSLDTATAPELDRELTQTLAERVNDLVFDLALLKFVSSAGLRLFSVARKQLVARGGRCSIINMQPQVEEVFAIIEKLPGFGLFKDIASIGQVSGFTPKPGVGHCVTASNCVAATKKGGALGAHACIARPTASL